MKNFNILDYIHEAEEIEKLYSQFINLWKITPKIFYSEIPDKAKPIKRELLTRYEIWFAVTKRIVNQFSDKYDIFESNYQGVINCITEKPIQSNENAAFDSFIDIFDKQVNILRTVVPIISLKETNFKKIITAELLDSELSQAELLYKHDFYRAAGAIAGVVLERFLKTLCEVNQITIGENDTIDPLAAKIYTSKKIPEFDITLFKSIQHLASIRNKCDHPKEEPKQHEVRELLDKVKKITFLEL
ncbi:MAG: hypothetical protein WAW23_10825 [Candidatus Methanoperedens sp.]